MPERQLAPDTPTSSPSRERQEALQERQASSISHNDEQLLHYMLYPDEGPMQLYSKLVGDSPSSERGRWSAEAQHRAQAGVRQLFETALDPVRFREIGLDGARAGLRRLHTEPGLRDAQQQLASAGRKLEYQNVGLHHDDLRYTGDFLHFGVNFSYPYAPDRLTEAARIYVTPTMSSVGRVAAEVITAARRHGYEPYGKLWDESSNTAGVSQRTDRLLFYPRTESQLRIVIDALAQVQADSPALFESDPPLLCEKTDIPGVGIAEDPPKINGVRDSFNQSREAVLQEAWNVTLQQVMGPKRNDYTTGHRGMILDKRLTDLRHAVDRGAVPQQQLIAIYRHAVRNLSPAYGISPDNFARNL